MNCVSPEALLADEMSVLNTTGAANEKDRSKAHHG
jgi:hypothetical protein